MELQTGQYLGETSFRKALHGIIIAQSQHVPYTKIPAHHHVNPHFTFVLEGRYTEVFEGQPRQYQRGDLIFHPAQAEHSNAFEQRATACFNVEIGAECYAGLGADLRRTGRYAVLSNPRQKSLLLNMVQEAKAPDAFSEAIVFGNALELAGLFLREQQAHRPEPPFVQRVKAVLADTPQLTPSLAELSQVAQVSPEYLCREFRRTVGITLGAYMRQRKVALACTLLAQRRLTTEEVAFETGFTDASHLNKVFRKVMGLSPTAYRQQLL
jgi:AraC family transcriptional regulator